MPLLFYVDNLGLRTPERLEAREANMTARGWGPGSANRARLMQGQCKDKGKGKDDAKGKGVGDVKGKGV